MEEPLRSVLLAVVAEPIEFVDVGHTQLIKVLLILQTLDWNWRKEEKKQARTKTPNWVLSHQPRLPRSEHVSTAAYAC